MTKAFLQNGEERLLNSESKHSKLIFNSVSDFIHTFSTGVHAPTLLFDNYVVM